MIFLKYSVSFLLLSVFLLNPLELEAKKNKSNFDHKHRAWTKILKKHVHWDSSKSTTQVEYKKISKKELNSYIEDSLKITKKELEAWTKKQQLAFYINLYNALTIQIVLKNYPVKSIKDIGSLFSSVWKKDFFTLFGEEQNLDYIEQELVRESGRYKDPRIHFAFNCASIGCPALLPEAFVADKLDKQFEFAAKTFLKDKKRNHYNKKEKELMVSKIFSWYRDDFTKWKKLPSLKAYFANYSQILSEDKKTQNAIRQKKIDIDFLDYNWNLNEK